MARLPADEDYARALLSIFRAKKLHVRQTLGLSEARAQFLVQNMGRVSDFEAALDYAVSRGWLAPALDRIRLTGPGAEEMLSAGAFP